MKITLLIASFFLFFCANGQNELAFELTSSWKFHQIVLNGDTVLIDSNRASLQTNYPVFDTLFMDGRGPILCNFKPDSSYTLILACCGTVDIVQTYKWESWKQVVDAHPDSIFEVLDAYPYLVDLPEISMQLTSNVPDTIYGWYADYACFPTLKRMVSDHAAKIPIVKCYYWTNISTFEFFKSQEDYLKLADEAGEIEDAFREVGAWSEEVDPLLGSLTVRLFDGGHYLITYDPKSGAMKLTSEE